MLVFEIVVFVLHLLAARLYYSDYPNCCEVQLPCFHSHFLWLPTAPQIKFQRFSVISRPFLLCFPPYSSPSLLCDRSAFHPTKFDRKRMVCLPSVRTPPQFCP